MTFTLCRVSQTKLLAEVSSHGSTTDSYWLLSVALGVFRDPTVPSPLGNTADRRGFRCARDACATQRVGGDPVFWWFPVGGKGMSRCSSIPRYLQALADRLFRHTKYCSIGPVSGCINRSGSAFQYSEWFPVGGEGKAPAEPLSCHSEYCSIWLIAGDA